MPDLATALPAPADGGKTYRFRLRTGIKYSNGISAKPEDFRRAIERVFIINHGGGPATFFYSGLAGATRCVVHPPALRPRAGIVANDRANTVTFHLTAPDPEFLDKKSALPFADAVPAGTPGRQLSPGRLPATGPYLTRRFAPGKAGFWSGTHCSASGPTRHNPAATPTGSSCGSASRPGRRSAPSRMVTPTCC